MPQHSFAPREAQQDKWIKTNRKFMAQEPIRSNRAIYMLTTSHQLWDVDESTASFTAAMDGSGMKIGPLLNSCETGRNVPIRRIDRGATSFAKCLYQRGGPHMAEGHHRLMTNRQNPDPMNRRFHLFLANRCEYSGNQSDTQSRTFFSQHNPRHVVPKPLALLG